MHFAGLPSSWCSENGIGSVRAPLCSTRSRPVTGPTTDRPERVACPECRKILKLRPLPPGEMNDFDESERRYP